MADRKLRVAHLSGPTATIQNSPPLITSNKARSKHKLPLRMGADGDPLRYDALRPQKLAAPVKVLVEQFSAHPLEADLSELYAAPDGYLDAAGHFRRHRQTESDRPVYEIELLPEDGLYPLPYMARQASGLPWESDSVGPDASAEGSRQTFYPDGARTFEEIDRFGIYKDGTAGSLSAEADVRLTALPYKANAISLIDKRLVASPIRIRDDDGYLTERAIPSVSIVKDGGYCELDWTGDPSAEHDLIAVIGHKLSLGLLTGLVYEGTAPAGNAPSPARLSLLVRAAFSGIPVVRVGRGSHEGFADTHPFLIGGSNLTATKARILLMACLMRFGSLPAASDPDSPTPQERDQFTAAVARFQSAFDSH